jgi:hypothetical protein
MRNNFWSGLSVFFASVLLMVWLIPAYGGRGFGGSVSPKFMPYVGAAIMMCASAVVWISALVTALKTRHRLISSVPVRSVILQIWPFAFVGLAIIGITWGGLIYSGPFMICALLLILGERRTPVLFCASIGPPCIIWVLATQLMRVGMV